MPALPLRLVILAVATALPLGLLAACAADGKETSATDTSALTADERVIALILEAFATSTPTNYTPDLDTDRSCLSRDPATKVLTWNVLGGQWFAPTLRVGLALRDVTDRLTVVETPSAVSGLLDIKFYGTPTNLDGAASSLCGPDGGAGAAVLLLDCKGIASTGMMTSIAPNQCAHPSPSSSPSP